MPNHRNTRRALVPGGCHRPRRPHRVRVARPTAPRAPAPAPPTSSGSATSPTSPTPPPSSAWTRGSFPEALGDTKLETADLQRRPGRGRGAVRRRDGRDLHRPEPGHQRLRPERRRGGPDHRRRHLRRRPARRPRGHRLRRRTSKGKTLATPQLGNTQDVALRAWLAEQGLKNSVAAAAVTSPSRRTENADTLRPVQGRQARRRLGAGAVGVAAGARGRRARSWSTRRTCGRRASSSPRTSSCAPSSSSSTRRRSRRCCEATSRPCSGSTPNPGEAQDSCQHGPREAHRQGAARRRCSTARGAT